MSGFDARWLDLREPYDAAARDAGLELALGAWMRERAPAPGSSVSGARAPGAVVDLGAGTGSNLRHLAPRLGSGWRWVLVDRDDDLLGEARRRFARAGNRAALAPDSTSPAVSTRRLDLATGLAALDLVDVALVSAAALLDLVSRAWVEALAARCARVGVPALLVLSYDGRIEWSPCDPGDAEVREMVNVHQRGDKGFGPALGPTAVDAAGAAFAAHAYTVRTATSDWVLGPGDAALQRALLDGWVDAAKEIAPRRAADLDAWRRRRLALVDAGGTNLRVGHLDLLAYPA